MIAIDQFTGDGSTTGFALSSSVSTASPAAVFVTIDGVSQLANAYSLSGTTLTFTEAPANSAVIEARYGTDTDQNVSNFTGDGSETSFQLAKTPSSNAAAFVSIDGVIQRVNTYTLSGSTLTFSSAPPSGAEIEVRFGFDAMDLAGSFTASGSLSAFSMNISANADDRVVVLVDGVFQHTSAYSVNGTELSFSSPPPAGAQINARRLTTQPAPFRGACVHSTNSIPGTGIVIWVIIAYDTDGIWTSSANTRLTVPSGVKRARIYGQAVHAGDGTGSGRLSMGIKKNGAYGYGGESLQALDVSDLGVVNALNAQTPALEVSAGDYFELDLDADDGTWDEASTWFAMDVVE